MATFKNAQHMYKHNTFEYVQTCYRAVVCTCENYFHGHIKIITIHKHVKLKYLSRLIVEEKPSLQYCLDYSGPFWECEIQLVHVLLRMSCHCLKVIL